MAKKTAAKKFSFSEIGKVVDQIAKKQGIIVEDGTVSKEFIGTGIYILNALLSTDIYGGIMSNRITALAGVSGVGKSFVCYNIAREAQKQDCNVIYIDTEHSIELEDLEGYGIDTSPDKLKLIRSSKVEDLKVMITQILDQLKQAKQDGAELDKFLFIIDSVGQLASAKEVEDAIEGKNKADMTRAKQLKSLFRIINSDLGYLGIPLLATNHTYFTMDLFPQEVMSGGSALVYTASTIVFLSKAKLKEGDVDELDMQAGIVVTAKAAKNRLAQPKKIKFEISFKDGCNPYKGLEFFCNEHTYAKVGIGKGKEEVDKETGEISFKEGGNRWYVSHLGKYITKNQLHTPEVFTKEVLDNLRPIIQDYFKYKSIDDIKENEKEFLTKHGEDDNFGDIDLDLIDGDDVFE